MKIHDKIRNNETYIIAEIGVNHNGDKKLLQDLILAAQTSGADACKFQTFKADKLALKNTPKVKYQMSTTDNNETHWEMLKSLEFSHEMHLFAIEKCRELNLDFISTPYDPSSVEYLHSLGVRLIKTASADIVDHRIHKKIAQLKLKPIVAVGMATINEIKLVCEIYNAKQLKPILLHCVSNYPCAQESLNLRVLIELQEKLDTLSGFSDHSVGPLGAQISVALGAKVVEKHFTLDKNLPGPDHKASSTPDEFKILVNGIREVEKILGSGEKKIQDEEAQMYTVSRKSIVASNNLSAGTILTESSLEMLRPGGGLCGDDYYKLIGRKLSQNLVKGEKLSWDKVVDI